MPANRKLKIAMISVHSCPIGSLGARDTGGMNVYIRELARKLGRQGHTIDVFSRVHDPNDSQIVELGQNARLIHLRAGEEEAMHKLLMYSYLPDFACNLENFRRNNELTYDLIFSHYWLSGIVADIWQHWYSIPNITMFHTLGAVKNALDVGEDEPELRIKTEGDIIRGCQHIIASTQREKEALAYYYGASLNKISVVPCGVNLELFRPIDKTKARRELGFGDERLVLFAGRIEPLKGVDQLVRAMSYLPKSQRVRLTIIGGDEYSQNEIARLEKLSQELQVQDSVTFRGLIKHEQMPLFYSAADVSVVPSYYESFALVALESLACGTPVVATDVGDLKHIIRQGKTGYVISDNNPVSLGENIGRVLNWPAPNTRTAAIRASVARFSWSRVAREIVRESHLLLSKTLTHVS